MNKLFFLGAAFLAACSSEDTGGTGDANVVDVTLSANQFSPATVSVKVGQVVRWTWSGGEHNVVSGTACTQDDNFRSGAPKSGGSFDKKFEKAGTFPYFCEVHCSMGMKGEVVVTE